MLTVTRKFRKELATLFRKTGFGIGAFIKDSSWESRNGLITEIFWNGITPFSIHEPAYRIINMKRSARVIGIGHLINETTEVASPCGKVEIPKSWANGSKCVDETIDEILSNREMSNWQCENRRESAEANLNDLKKRLSETFE